MQNFYVMGVFLAYFSVLLIFAIRSHLKIKTFSDYVMGGRSLSPLLCAMNAGASDMSSWLMMGFPAAFYLHGMNQIWIVIGLIAGSWCSWKFVAVKLRVETEKLGDALTIPMFLERRFKDDSGILRIVCSVMIVVFFTVYIASCLVGGAKLFVGIFDLGYINALLISSVVIIGYACIGGFMAISWADLLQGTLMLIAIVVVPIMMYFDMSKSVDVVHLLQLKEGYLNPFFNTTFMGILTSLAWGLGYFGQPHIISKYMAIKDPKGLPLSRFICTSWMSIAMFGAVMVGIFGGIFFIDKELNIIENILIVSSFLLVHPIFFGLILTAILAAIMSTINGQLIICSSLLVEDFYKGFIKKNATQKQLILASRVSIAIITIIALCIATDSNSSILMLVAHAWSGLGASLGPVILFSLYSTKITKNAAIAGIVSGGFGSIFFVFIPVFSYELLPAFILSCLTIWLVSKNK